MSLTTISKRLNEKQKVLRLFVSLGGKEDGTGIVSCAQLSNMVQLVCDMNLNITALIRLLEQDIDGLVDFSRFRMLFK